MIRIIGGNYKGRKLQRPPDRITRPTQHQVREAVFNMIHQGIIWQDTIVLDVFAGSGAYGIEALSRGAESAIFIDNNRQVCKILHDNVRLVGAGEYCRIFTTAIDRLPVNKAVKASLVFLDPPYGRDIISAALQKLATQQWLAVNALVVIEQEYSTVLDLPTGFTFCKERRYGRTAIRVCRYVAEPLKQE